jgi:diguanylate cyclase (GGDEF)-like protein
MPRIVRMPDAPETRTPLQILFIEADEVDVILVRRALKQSSTPFDLTSSRTLAEALRLLSATSFDAILVDLSLPDSGGLEGLEQLAAASPDTPIVVLTGLADNASAMAALEAGAQDYLVKGQTNKDLLERTLRYAIQRQQIVSENRRLMEQLRQLARIDPLTGVLNRHSFAEVLDVEWTRAERHSRALSCVMLDIDFFKRVNDTYGHATGDAALKHVAALLKEHCRKEDFVARYGGEEFCLLLTDTHEAGAATWADRLRQKLAARPLPVGSKTLRLTASFGVASRHESSSGVAELLNQADQALYRAKQTGRDRVVTFGQMQQAEGSHAQPLIDASYQQLIVP